MSARYTVEQADGITYVRFVGVAGFDDAIDAAIEVEGLKDNSLRLWDLSGGVDVSTPDVRRLGEHAKSKLSLPSKVAIVAPEDHPFGIARMHEVFREHPDVAYQVFRSEDEAVSWLLEPKAD